MSDTIDVTPVAGQTLTDVRATIAGTDEEVLAVGDVELPASGNYTIFVGLDADGVPTAQMFEHDTSKIKGRRGRVIVRHMAAAPSVDVIANGEVVFTDLSNGGEAQADVGIGPFSAQLVPTGDDDPFVLGPSDLNVVKHGTVIVYAVGTLDNGLTAVVQTIDVQRPGKGLLNRRQAKNTAKQLAPTARFERVIVLDDGPARYEVQMNPKKGDPVSVLLDAEFNLIEIKNR